MHKRTIILGLFLFLSSASLFLEASELRPFELSARAAALGGAFVARTDDSSSVFYSPAALAFSSGVMVKLNMFFPKTTITAEYSSIPTSPKSIFGSLGGSAFVSLNIKERIGLGIGVFFPNWLETNWPHSWEGRDLSIYSKFNTVYIRPVAAVKICRYMAVGVGLDIISSSAAWKYNSIFFYQEIEWGDDLNGSSESKVKAKGLSYVAGAMIKISDNLRLGGRYQPKVRLDFDGAHTLILRRGNAYLFGRLQRTSSSLTVPQEFVLGAMYSLGENMTFQLDFQRINMSEIDQWKFDIDPESFGLSEDFFVIHPDYARHGVDLKMKDISRIMFGVEYHFKDSITVRAGYSHQTGAVENQMIHPAFPDLDTNILSFGIGYDGPTFSVWDTFEKLGGISLDAFFQYGFSPKSTSALPEFPATYRARRWIVGFGVGITLGSS